VIFFFDLFLLKGRKGRAREGEGMSTMMDKWLEKVKPGDKGMTRPPVSVCVSAHKNEVRSILVDISKSNSG
jgi:hypothetical protein